MRQTNHGDWLQTQMDKYSELAENGVVVRYPEGKLPQVALRSKLGYLRSDWTTGCTLPSGYRVVRINGYNHYVHRIVYMDYYKKDIMGVIRFKDGNPSNTDPENLYDSENPCLTVDLF